MDGMQTRNSQASQATTLVTENVHKQPFVIGVARVAASGKTTVCDVIIEQLHDQRVVLVNQVSLISPSLTIVELMYRVCKRPCSDSFDNEKLLSAMEMLKPREAVGIPKYNFKSYKNNVSRRVSFFA
ncbi:Uridine kinase-like protein [Cynara cardunculus var. scolymus]|uniref:Uridine kinase-like protein n=1 Tax=Cynara cardunculus var. scolymus TaxID=59895 RepID=A0A118JTY8_CYNCS|nr:Uridine kinase-like protein [Cynara cardunculus var. scolymus]